MNISEAVKEMENGSKVKVRTSVFWYGKGLVERMKNGKVLHNLSIDSFMNAFRDEEFELSVMTFSMQHSIFKDLEPTVFTEDDPPSWLLSHVFKGWWDDYVLKLEVGKSIETDFQIITRVS